MNTEDDTFDKLKGLTAIQMFDKLKAHHSESNTTLHLVNYLTAMNISLTVIKERNDLLRKYNWKYEDFAREMIHTNIYE